MIATNELTAKQQAVLDYIRSFRREHGYAPSIRDLMGHFQIKSPNGMVCHLRSLLKKGKIVWSESTSRSIRLTEPDPATELLQECADVFDTAVLYSGLDFEAANNLCHRIKEFLRCSN